MSDHFIALIPTDPKARPPADTLAALKSELSALCESDEARIKDFKDRLQFIDCGENFEHISCPACDTQADVDWWGQRMDHAWNDDEGFHLCSFEMPCCGATSQLDALKYSYPQGFSTWFVSVRNPGRGKLSTEEQKGLEATAGIPLQVIYQMY